MMTDSQNTELREAFLARSRSPAPFDHPSAEEIYDASAERSSIARSRRLEIIDHIGRCAHCAEAWRLARAIDDAQVPAASKRSRIRRSSVAALALAASLVLAVGLWLQQEEAVDTWEQPSYRAPESAPMQSRVGEALPRQDVELSWTPHPSAVSYVLQVTDAGLEPLFRLEDLEVPRARVPEEALSNLQSGDAFLWRVEARLEDGGSVASETFITTLR